MTPSHHEEGRAVIEWYRSNRYIPAVRESSPLMKILSADQIQPKTDEEKEKIFLINIVPKKFAIYYTYLEPLLSLIYFLLNKYLHYIVTDTAKIFHYGWYGYVLAAGTFVTIIERKYCEVLLMMTTDQRRMWMIYLTMAASLIMTDSANNGGGGAVCAQERDEIQSITCSRCRHNPIAAYTRHSVLH